MDFITAQNRAQELTKQLEYHNNLYYNQDEPEISDYDYDMLMRELENIEKGISVTQISYVTDKPCRR